FDDRRSAAVARLLGPELATSLGRRAVARWWLAAAAGVPHRRVRVPRTAVALQVPASAGALPVVSRRSVSYAHRLGLQVHVWTVNEAAEMHRLLDLGVDGLISDRADTLSQVLTSRATRTA
ncbi:MAG TPA: glycerophosphodiester phosphodiesterase family protein, partial [Angustibacter sp.]|nr:glycerophosphodiester phosphodiesterase family protein [Angustibacter sp.]